MKNSSNKALPMSIYPLTVVRSDRNSSAPDPLRFLRNSNKNVVEHSFVPEPLYQVHQMVKEKGNWDEDWFNSYE